jgi:hypothetical protein
MNDRLYKFMINKNLISASQIGFMKNKRTADHIFVLKAILEEAKSRRKPIYACFVDLKKAFDTVWMEGLYYKLLFQYQISSKFVKNIQSLYLNILSCVRTDGNCSKFFHILIGLRQGCNLSPYLFNLYINDLVEILYTEAVDPVSINGKELNSLLYADDMLLLSHSEEGLQKSLDILDAYCHKWQLVVNTSKTKIMIFNTRKQTTQFDYRGQPFEIVP